MENQMKKNDKIINILLIVIMILVVLGCAVGYLYFAKAKPVEEDNNKETLFTLKNYPKIDGSISTLPLAEAFKSAFTGTDIENVDVTHSKTHNAYLNLINKNVDLILVPYPSEEELQLAEQAEVELEIVPVVKEPFVFFVNKENVIDNLSLTQIQDIYSGKITRWNEVGGADAEILAFQKPTNSESQNGMVSLIMQDISMMPPITETINSGMTDIIGVISEYNNKSTAIGYAYDYYAKTMYPSDSIKYLSIDEIEPTYDNIKNGLYRFQTTYYAVIRKDEPEDSDARKLLKEMISTNGQNIAKEAGYVQNY